MNSKKYLPLLLLVATSALSTQCINSSLPLNAANKTGSYRGAAAIQPLDVTLPVENEVTLPVESDLYPIFPIKTEEGHVTYPMPGDDYEQGIPKPLPMEEGYAKPLPIEEGTILPIDEGTFEGYPKPLPVDEENIILPRLDYEEVDILPYEPRIHKKNDSKWYGDKKWRKKNEYGVVDILPYPESEEVNILPYPGNDEEISILPYYPEEEGMVHGWEDEQAKNPGGMPWDLPQVEEPKRA